MANMRVHELAKELNISSKGPYHWVNWLYHTHLSIHACLIPVSWQNRLTALNETISYPYRRIEIIDLKQWKDNIILQHKILNYDIDNFFKYNNYGNSNVRRK